MKMSYLEKLILAKILAPRLEDTKWQPILPQNLFFKDSKSIIMCVLVRYQSCRFSSQPLLLIMIKLSIHELRSKLDSLDGKGSGSQYFIFLPTLKDQICKV